jgi:chorismate mutase
MATRYTQYIENLEISQWPPEKLFEHLKEDLRAELKRRCLWMAPPEWLGYPDIESWNEQGALDALAFDCYKFAIVTRIRGLRNQLKKKNKDNIDGLISLNIRHFLTEQQEKHDPEGYAVGSNVYNAIQQLIEERRDIIRAQKLDKAGKLCDKTVLTFPPADPTPYISDEKSLWDAIRQHTDWLNERFEMLRISEDAQEKLSKIVCQLAKTHIISFQYQDLITLLKNDARAAGKASDVALEVDNTKPEYDDEDEELPQRVKITLPDTTYEDWKNWKGLIDKISLKIFTLKRRNEIPKKVYAIFQEWAGYTLDIDEPIPSQKELARRLALPPQTVNDYVKILRELFVAYVVETNVEQAIQRAVEQKTLTLQDLDEKGQICNQTKLIFSTTQSTTVFNEKLLRSFEAWLYVRLRLAQGDMNVQDNLLEVIYQLAENPIAFIQFGKLVKAMTKDAIAAWRAFERAVKKISKRLFKEPSKRRFSHKKGQHSIVKLCFIFPPQQRLLLVKKLYRISFIITRLGCKSG